MLNAFIPPSQLFTCRLHQTSSSAVTRRHATCSLREYQTSSSANSLADDAKTSKSTARRRAPMSEETRKKISDALKGRRKSPEHRESLRKRFGGAQNPMYGRTLSAESRAKISRAVTANAQRKKKQAPQKPPIEEKALETLKKKALVSRLVTSVIQPQPKQKRIRLPREQHDPVHLNKILERVASLVEPPDSVLRTLQNTRRKRNIKENERNAASEGRESSATPQFAHVITKTYSTSKKKERDESLLCSVCYASGLKTCPNCAGAFGVVSSRCQLCFGAGGVFCDACQGVGSFAQVSKLGDPTTGDASP